MMDDENAVPGHRKIKLERRYADRQRLGEADNGILGSQAARAAVPLQVERAGGGTCDECREYSREMLARLVSCYRAFTPASWDWRRASNFRARRTRYLPNSRAKAREA